MSKLLIVVIVACVAGCSGDGSSPAVDGGDVDALPDPSGPGALLATRWYFDTYAATADSCGGRLDQGGAFTVDMVTAAGFRISGTETSRRPTSICMVNPAHAFTCTTPQQAIDKRPALDAVMTFDLELFGKVTSTTKLTGTEVITIGCRGADCDLDNTSPCTRTATFTAVPL